MEGLRRGNGNGDRSGRSWVQYSPNLPAIPLERAKNPFSSCARPLAPPAGGPANAIGRLANAVSRLGKPVGSLASAARRRWQAWKPRWPTRRRRFRTGKRCLQVRKTPKNGPFSPRTPILALFHSPKRESAKTDYCLLITIYCRFRPPNRKPAENCPRPPRISQRRLGTTPPTPGPQTHARFPNARERASSTHRHTAGLACKARPRAVEEHGRPVPPVRLRHDDSCKKYGSKYCY